LLALANEKNTMKLACYGLQQKMILYIPIRRKTMSNKTTKRTLATAIGATLAGGLAFASNTQAADNPFSVQELNAGYMQVAMEEGKCGEGKCGSDMKATEGKCGEGKCGGDMMKAGEGKCGGEKAKEGSCGGKMEGTEKSMEGKCGEGKCGSKK
jgi:uncharacterized low-complexity protein